MEDDKSITNKGENVDDEEEIEVIENKKDENKHYLKKDTKFEQLKLTEWLIDECKELNIVHPTYIQAECIPQILKGNDVIGCAKTGYGKTAAFALPILNELGKDPYGIYALVLSPTRELAYQIYEQFKILGKKIKIRLCVICGGMDMIEQTNQLNKLPHIVISTPGRLVDHIKSNSSGFSLKKIKFLVLDEADRLLSDMFHTQLERILQVLPSRENRQTLLFSATFNENLIKTQNITKKNRFIYHHHSQQPTVDQLKQFYVLMPSKVKDTYLLYLLVDFITKQPNISIIVFTNTCRNCQLLALLCRESELEAIEIHSVLRQKQRLEALNKFRANKIKILIATDVAARGLDVPLVDVVINHNVPNVPGEYIHRVGRTARAGRSGMSITLVTQKDVENVYAIEKRINDKLVEYEVKENAIIKMVKKVSTIRAQIDVKLKDINFGEKKRVNKLKRLK
ncbi:hypothetical protein SNEBB_008422 [Seison nebaliae]|nr:hypothetical protein SNEBB_008422 [Seison nebaliae]